jgi:uncharacterized protein YjgD (DUF1641 family)
MTQELTEMNEKLDTLLGFMQEQQSRQQAMEELKDDVIPMVNQMIKLTIDELAEIGTEFRVEDLLFLIKRLLRNTNLLISLVDQLEGIMGLADEVDLLGKQVFNQVVDQLDQLEHKGYFSLANESMALADKVVAEINPEDVQGFGDTLVRALQAAKQPLPEKAPSMIALLIQMTDPQVRIGLTRMLTVVKSISA